MAGRPHRSAPPWLSPGPTLVPVVMMFFFLSAAVASAQSLTPAGWRTVGRGPVIFGDGRVSVDDCFIHATDTLADAFLMTFRARSLGDEVQIWSGFGYHDRDHRYALGLRGGNNNDL